MDNKEKSLKTPIENIPDKKQGFSNKILNIFNILNRRNSRYEIR
jgi:hypothetical protein